MAVDAWTLTSSKGEVAIIPGLSSDMPDKMGRPVVIQATGVCWRIDAASEE